MRQWTIVRLGLTLLLGLLGVACDAGDGGAASSPDVVVGADVGVSQDVTTAPDVPAGEDVAPGVTGDTGGPLRLPSALPFSYEREQAGEPVSDAEVTAFTKKLMRFLAEVHYADYILYSTHGVDASTGMPDWQFWYGVRVRKEGDLVTWYHPEDADGGGHNLHIPMSKLLGDLIAGYLLTEDETIGLATQQLCKGMSASMLGMVANEDDTLLHLMSRNVVPGFSQEFLTHDGKQKAVDCSGWYSDYVRWNTWRFEYTDNPYWGDVWVTNMRSKDDVPHIFRLIPNLRYLVDEGPDGEVREACTTALGLLELWAKDIVESGYVIRTKDQDGVAFLPGQLGDPELDAEKDLASFVWFDDILPNGECNAKRGAELVGYHEATVSDCGEGGPNGFEAVAFVTNKYNKRIYRYFHLAHLANALVNRDEAAEGLMAGLEERFELEWNTPEAEFQYAPEDWYRNLALYHAQAYSYGYPLTNDEVAFIHTYYDRAIDKHGAWAYWDPWDEAVEDGELGGNHPPDCEGSDDDKDCWWRAEDMGQVFEACWSPFVNPTSARWVDCDIVRDPSRWLE